MAERVSGADRNKSIRLTMRIDGAQATLAAFRDLPKEASDELREKSLELSDLMARWLQGAGSAEGRQAALLAGTVKAKRDRLPYVMVGGTKRIGRAWPGAGRAPAYQLLFGSEFGSSRGHGFKPHRGRAGYWIFPTVEAEESTISRKWNEAADEVVAKFTSGASDVGPVIG